MACLANIGRLVPHRRLQTALGFACDGCTAYQRHAAHRCLVQELVASGSGPLPCTGTLDAEPERSGRSCFGGVGCVAPRAPDLAPGVPRPEGWLQILQGPKAGRGGAAEWDAVSGTEDLRRVFGGRSAGTGLEGQMCFSHRECQGGQVASPCGAVGCAWSRRTAGHGCACRGPPGLARGGAASRRTAVSRGRLETDPELL
mmetsp:Transcript_4234/g.10460  ORF Transcript_4234/g.10460 Transcript_4234/m.10460 type:complete len:200 (-) Transcript_4234:98-697(-)